METTMSIKDLHINLKKIPDMVDSWDDILVLKNSKPAFRITSVRAKRWKKYTMNDLMKLQFSSKEKTLSLDMDKYIY